MEPINFYMLIAIAILEIIDGKGIALKILRMLSNIIGGDSNVKKVESTEVKK